MDSRIAAPGDPSMTPRTAVLVAAVSLGLAPTAGLAPAVAGDLAAVDIERLLVGRAIRWWVEDSWLYGDLFLAPGGRAALAIATGEPEETDEGRWRLAGDEICTVWRHARTGNEKCYRVRRVTERRFVTTGGNVFEIAEPET
jgi:uncharacterized membrane protein